jgi:L-seryl-tRNA(Ser) seleniumtransferase
MDDSSEVKRDPRRDLPSVDRLLRDLRERAPATADWALRAAARQVLGEARGRAGTGAPAPAGEALLDRVLKRAQALLRPRPGRVVNATGVVLHTNLGRAVLAPGAAHAAAEAASGYTDLELDLETGERGNRLEALAEKLVLLSGAEAAFVVNNNAGAVLLAASALAAGREVVVSRGELVEIGGSFRIPEILARAGVRLVEVGTTNRTHPEDYRRAIGPATGLLLKVHQSNFEQRGFVAEVPLAELAAIAREASVPLAEDLGSATLVDLRERGLPPESYAPARLALGADLVCFSGDKLLGGPQAGILLGRREAITALRTNPLARALRPDRMILAALDWTLRAMLEGRAEAELPVLRQLLEPDAELERRARALAARLEKVAGRAAEVDVLPHPALVGGGSLPGFALASWVVRLRPAAGAAALAARLRRAAPPVLARVQDGALLLDARTLLPEDPPAVESALRDALGAAAAG